MSKPVSSKRHRFLPEIIAHAVWLYFRFPLSLRLVEEMLLERGVVILRDHPSLGTEVRARVRSPRQAQDAKPSRYLASR